MIARLSDCQNWPALPDESIMMTASMLVLLPVLILLFVAQRQLVQGIAMTGLKG